MACSVDVGVSSVQMGVDLESGCAGWEVGCASYWGTKFVQEDQVGDLDQAEIDSVAVYRRSALSVVIYQALDKTVGEERTHGLVQKQFLCSGFHAIPLATPSTINVYMEFLFLPGSLKLMCPVRPSTNPFLAKTRKAPARCSSIH